MNRARQIEGSYVPLGGVLRSKNGVTIRFDPPAPADAGLRRDDARPDLLAVQVVPYPPGIPLPGERFGKETRVVGDFLLGLEALDAKFPGFGHDTHGVEVKTDKSGRSYHALYCLKE